MTNEEFGSIGLALRAVASAIAERQRQEGAGARPPFQFLSDTLGRESTRLQVNGAPQLAEGLLALRSDLSEMDNA